LSVVNRPSRSSQQKSDRIDDEMRQHACPQVPPPQIEHSKDGAGSSGHQHVVPAPLANVVQREYRAAKRASDEAAAGQLLQSLDLAPESRTLA